MCPNLSGAVIHFPTMTDQLIQVLIFGTQFNNFITAIRLLNELIFRNSVMVVDHLMDGQFCWAN